MQAALRSLVLGAALSGITLFAIAQKGFSDQELAQISALGAGLEQRCLAKPPIANIPSGNAAFSYDNAAACGCVKSSAIAVITPEMMRRDSTEEGRLLGQRVSMQCRTTEYVNAFARDCPAMARRTQGFDRSHPKAKGADNFCRCVVQRLRAQTPQERSAGVETSFDTITIARKHESGMTLDAVYIDEATDAACGGAPPTASASRGAARDAAPPPAPPPPPPPGQDVAAMDKGIDKRLIEWSANWIIDRYIRGSAHTTRQRCEDANCNVSGTFQFSRAGTLLTIPFDAEIEKGRDGSFAVTKLCYVDISNGGVRACL